jgi:L-asparagine oxygenase
MSTTCLTLRPTASESASIRGLLDELISDPDLHAPEAFLEQAHLAAQALPARIRESFYRFKRDEDHAVLLVRGNPVLRDGAGPTPQDFPETRPGYRLNDAQMLHGLYGSLLGEAVGFTSQRNGSIYNNIVPSPGLRQVANSSSGSAFDFGFHVEDAFHPARADYVGLLCLRNDEGAATTVACVDGLALADDERDVLFEPRFRIAHNPIHADTTDLVEEDGQAVFFGDRERPYVRINAATLRLDDHGGLERRALAKLLAHFEQQRLALTLESRDCLYIDNYRCVHARDAYRAKFGPEARWLSRVVFTNDLRKSRSLRASVQARAIAA